MPENRGTSYAETEALLAALSDDEEGMEQWLGELLPGERASLDSALNRMSRSIMRLRQQEHNETGAAVSEIDLEVVARIDKARRVLNAAALNIAASVDVSDRIANDPTFPADRSARADALRSERRVADLIRYREADAVLALALRLGDCDYCSSPLAVCRAEPGTFCCEDCTHPRSSDPS